MSIGIHATTMRSHLATWFTRRAILAVLALFAISLADVAQSSACVGQQAEDEQPGFDANLHPYIEESPKQLAKRIPELKGMKPAADQQDLARILQKTGESVDEFFDNAVDLVADEEIKQERSLGFGFGGSAKPVRANYLILRHGNGATADFDEFRTDEKGNRLEAADLQRGFLVTAGFALICAHFSTGFQPESQFRYLGEEKVDGREAYVVGFAQIPGKATFTVKMEERGVLLAEMLLQGIAWVDTQSYHILRIRTDILAQQPKTELDAQTTKVDFSEVHLQDVAAPLWLPRDVKVYVKLGPSRGRYFEEAFQNEHRYRNYRRYRVSTKMVTPQ